MPIYPFLNFARWPANATTYLNWVRESTFFHPVVDSSLSKPSSFTYLFQVHKIHFHWILSMVWMQCWFNPGKYWFKIRWCWLTVLINIQIKQWTLRFEATEPTEPTYFLYICKKTDECVPQEGWAGLIFISKTNSLGYPQNDSTNFSLRAAGG